MGKPDAVPAWPGFDPTSRWVTWGGDAVIAANELSVKGGLPWEIARIECPSPRAIRVSLQCLSEVTAGTFHFNVRCGVGRIELVRTVTMTPNDSTDIEVAARICIVDVIATVASNAPVRMLATLAPLNPWNPRDPW